MRHLALFLLPVLSLAACADPEPASAETVAVSPEAAPEQATPVDLSEFDPALALGEIEWMRGEPVDLTTTESAVLLVQWATWCGPCKAEMPHLSALQAELGDKLTVVGISDEDPKVVKPFVKRNPERMAYTVGVASEDVTKAWATYASANAIPYSYLIQDNRVLWHGHPGGVDLILDQVLAGTWTHTLAAQHAAIPKARVAYFSALEDKTAAEARPLLQPMIDAPDIGGSVKNGVSWTILTEIDEDKRDLEVALTLIEQATAEAKHEDIALEDTLGLALFMNGKVEEAITVQARAVAMCADSDNPQALCDELSDRLKTFKES